MKKALTLLLISCLAFLALTAIKFSSTVRANAIPNPEQLPTEQAYIRSNGTIEPSTLPIQREGNVYRLTGNIINRSFEVESDNVVIEGNGFLLSVPAFGAVDVNGQTKGARPLISISNKSNIIVKNVIFDKYSGAIDIRNSSNIIIFHNTMRNGNTGIYMLRSANCSLVGNQIIDNVYGMLIQDSTFLNISYNKISRNQYGADIGDLTRSIFNGLQCSNITRNDFTDNENKGLYIRYPNSNNQIFENNFINNDVGLCIIGGGLAALNNTVYSNYWSNYRLQIEVNHVEEATDQSPLASPISTSFDPSLFPLPSLTEPSPPESERQTQTSEPFPTELAVVASIAMVTVVSVGLLVYFKKRKRQVEPK